MRLSSLLFVLLYANALPQEPVRDERVIIFEEIKQQADSGDLTALKELAEYYSDGKFPLTLRDAKKAQQLWELAATKGDKDSASKLSSSLLSTSAREDGVQDTAILIESIKWYLVYMGDVQSPLGHFPRVSKATHSEAIERARRILEKLPTGNKLPASSAGNERMQQSLPDDRLTLFNEINQKALAGDADALHQIAKYYQFGKHPVEKDISKSIELFIESASKGNSQSARELSLHYASMERGANGVIDTELAAEHLKWDHVASRNLSRISSSPRYSLSTRAEGLKRAQVFASQNPNAFQPSNSSPNIAPGFSPQNDPQLPEIIIPKFRTVQEVQSFRMGLLSEFRRAQQPLYTKQNNASQSETKSYLLVARKLAAFKTSEDVLDVPLVGRAKNISEATQRKIELLEVQIRDIAINTEPPFSRQDLNAAQTFLDRIRDYLDAYQSGH